MSGKEGQKAGSKVGGSFMGGVDPALVTIAFVVAIGFSIVQWLMKKKEDGANKSAKKGSKKVMGIILNRSILSWARQ